MPVRPRPAVLVTAGLIAAGGALLLAPAANAAPHPAPKPPASTLPALSPTRSTAPSQVPTASPAAPSTSPGRIAVPAGGHPVSSGGFGPAEIVLTGAGILLVAGGAVAARRQLR